MQDKQINDDRVFDSVVKKNRKKKMKNRILAVLIVFAVVVFGTYLCFEKLFIVKNIDVISLNSGEKIELPYTQEELLSGVGVSEGMKLYEKTESEMVSVAKYNLTYVKELEVSRRWPSTIVLKVTPENPLYYVTIDNSMYILSDDLKVLDATADIEQIEAKKLVLLQLDSVKKCVKGEKLNIDKDIEEIILNVTSVLDNEGSLSSVTMIDVRDKFGIELMYNTRYLVKLGDSKDMGNKIKMMNAIIEDKTDEIVSGTIDVTKDYGKTGTFKKFS